MFKLIISMFKDLVGDKLMDVRVLDPLHTRSSFSTRTAYANLYKCAAKCKTDINM